MLVIRLSRTGKKNKPQYRLIVQEKEWAPNSKAVEIVGHFNPHQADGKPVLNEERIKYWLGQGAQPSNTVWNMLVVAKVVEGEKRKVVQPKLKPAPEGEDSATPAPQESKEEKPATEEAPKEEVKEDSATPAPQESKEEAPKE